MNPDPDTGHNTSAPAHWGELKDANFTGPNQTSSNSTLPQLDVTRAISVGLVLGAFILFAIVGNILVILSVACNRHLRTPTNYFIVNLAIADLLLSFTVLPFSATLEVLGYWVLGRIFCDIWAAVDVLCCTASILSLCAISIDRYIGVRYSLRYPTLVTRRKAILALLSVWVLSTVISIGPLLGWKEPAPNDDRECGVTEEPFYALFSSLGSFYIPLAVILVMYCRVYIVAKRTTKNLEAGVMKEMSNSKELTLRIHSKNFHEDTLSSTKAKGHNPRSSIAVKLFKFSREKKAAKTLGIVVGMFILCWLPFFIALPLGVGTCLLLIQRNTCVSKGPSFVISSKVPDHILHGYFLFFCFFLPFFPFLSFLFFLFFFLFSLFSVLILSFETGLPVAQADLETEYVADNDLEFLIKPPTPKC